MIHFVSIIIILFFKFVYFLKVLTIFVSIRSVFIHLGEWPRFYNFSHIHSSMGFHYAYLNLSIKRLLFFHNLVFVLSINTRIIFLNQLHAFSFVQFILEVQPFACHFGLQFCVFQSICTIVMFSLYQTLLIQWTKHQALTCHQHLDYLCRIRHFFYCCLF